MLKAQLPYATAHPQARRAWQALTQYITSEYHRIKKENPNSLEALCSLDEFRMMQTELKRKFKL